MTTLQSGWALLVGFVATLLLLALLPPYLAFVALLVVAWRWPPARFGLPRVLRTLRCYLPLLGLWVLLLVGYLWGMRALGHVVPVQPTLQRLAAGDWGSAAFWSLLVQVVLLAPAMEELVFRGYLQNGLAKLLPPTAAVALAALFFGLCHGPLYALPVTLLGLLFGTILRRHGELLPAVCAHALHNGLTLLVTALWPGSLELLYPQ